MDEAVSCGDLPQSSDHDDDAAPVGHDLLDPAFLGGTEELAKLDTVILLDTSHSDLERVAHAVFPTRHAAEKSGTLTNHAGRVQRVEQAVREAMRG